MQGRFGRHLGTLAVCYAVVIGSGPASAQTPDGVVTGILVDARTRQPVAGALVQVTEGTRRAMTDAAGRFRLSGLPGPTIAVIVSAVGYRPLHTQIAVGTLDVRLGLSQAAVMLNDIVVTGTAGDSERRSLGNSIARLDAEHELELAPARDVTALINGRVPGVVVIPGSGQVGAGPTIQIRGARSFSLNTNPLVYIDGVRVDNEVGDGNTRVQGGSGVINRLNDVAPEDIERIEIIRGPAAATLYGTEASNGVIQIVTKSGRSGAQPEFSLTLRQGANWFMKPEGRIPPAWFVDTVAGRPVTLDLLARERSQGRETFRTGRVQGYALSARGGAETVRYFAGAHVDSDDGVEPTNYRNRLGLRGGLTINPSSKVQATANLGVARSHTQFACEGACVFGVWWSLITANPASVDSARRGFRFAPPDALWEMFDTFQDLDRTQIGLEVRHQPAAWLSHRLVLGEDRSHEDNQEFVRDNSIRPFFPQFAEGQKLVSRRDVSLATVDYSATVTFPLSGLAEGLRSMTTVGTQYYHKVTRLVGALGSQFADPGLETVSTATLTSGSESLLENNTLGFFAQQQLTWRDRIFLTGAVRADDNSAFGSEFDIVYYPKLSFSWVLHEEPWWHVPSVDAVRIRLAYGASGQQPQDFTALYGYSYAPVTSGGGDDAITPQYVGNLALGPERGEEFEAGVEAGFLNHRVGVDFTWYLTRTRDAILLQPVAPSRGFPDWQYVNAGEIRNRGIELKVNARPWEARLAAVDLALNLATNSNEVVNLGGVDRGYGYVEVPASIVRQRHVPGFPAGSWFTRVVLSAEVDPDGTAHNLMCDGGTGPRLPDGTGTRPGGTPVPCDAAPFLYAGRPFPALEGSFQLQLSLAGRLRLHALVDFRSGHRKLDLNLAIRCQQAQICRENFFPLEYDPRFIAAMLHPEINSWRWAIRDASFARLRELSASYTLPGHWAGRIGASRAVLSIAGRNLHSWSRHDWLDPEAEFVQGPGPVGGDRVPFNRQQLAHAPQLAQIITTVSLTF